MFGGPTGTGFPRQKSSLRWNRRSNSSAQSRVADTVYEWSCCLGLQDRECGSLNDDGSELVQIQQDRFVRNWRKRDDEDQYPRYSSLRESFKKDLEVFCRLVEEEGWGSVQANQCEVTYVNVMPSGEGWQEYCELDKVLTVFSRGCLDDQLQKPEEASLSMQYLLIEDDQPVGRLYIGANPVRECRQSSCV